MLDRLKLQALDDEPLQLLLPPQPVTLALWSGVFRLMSIRRVAGVEICTSMRRPGDVAAKLDVLQQLTAAPQPEALQLRFVNGSPSDAEFSQFVAAAVQLTGSTRLHCDRGYTTDADNQLCAQLVKLRGLANLALLVKQQCARDVVNLTALTCLTHLEIKCDLGLDDVAAVALACHLTGLHHLRWQSADIKSWAVLPAAARLPQLRSLHVYRSSVPCLQLTPDLLNMLLPLSLLPLSQLTYLSLPLGRPAC